MPLPAKPPMKMSKEMMKHCHDPAMAKMMVTEMCKDPVVRKEIAKELKKNKDFNADYTDQHPSGGG